MSLFAVHSTFYIAVYVMTSLHEVERSVTLEVFFNMREADGPSRTM